MSSDEEGSPAMQFTRSVRRGGRRPLASFSDTENTPPGPPVHQSVKRPLGHALQQSMQQPQYAVPASTGSPATPAGLIGTKLDLHDPYTPWLRTSTKPPLSIKSQGQGIIKSQAAAAAAAGTQEYDLCVSPVSASSSASGHCSSSRGSPVQPAAATAPSGARVGGTAAGTADALSSLCAAVADLQLKQQQHASTGRPSAAGSNGGQAASAVSGPADAAPADSASSPGQQQPTPTTPRNMTGGGDAHAPTGAAAADGVAGGSGSGSDSEEDPMPMTLGRRTAPRVFRRPMLTLDSDSECSGSSSSSDQEGSSPAGGRHSQAAGGCSGGHSNRRVTPGSTSSMVSLKRLSSSKQRPGPTDTGYTGAYDFDLHLSTLKPPRWQVQRHLQQQQQQQASATAGPAVGPTARSGSNRSTCSPFSASPSSPVAALSFTPGLGSRRAAAGSPASGLQGAPRRLSQSFLGSAMPLSPPVLKQQAAGLMTPAAAGKRGAQQQQQQQQQPARAERNAAAVPATTGKGRPPAGAGIGLGLWQPSQGNSSAAGGSSSSSSVQQPGAFTPSGRRGEQQPGMTTHGAGGGVGGSSRGTAVGCATAPAKVPSSRTFARQRQQLAQQLYEQWNAKVFDGQLPADLPLVWNPRLTATAGQVVDDGSRNKEKDCREQRIPVRLELSSKVIDNETRLRTTLSHEMCHVAAWVISRDWKQHHGPVFWQWAQHFEKQVPGIKITTCHNFDVHAPFRWQCSNDSCAKLYLRHKRSIDTNKHVCSRCQGRLRYLGKFSRDGKLIASSTPGAAAGAGGATPGGGNAFTLYVKTHFAEVKRALPTGTPHKEVMTRLAASYKEQKLVAATAAAAATATAAAAATATTTAAATATTTAAATAASATPGSAGVLPKAGRGLAVTAVSTQVTFTLTTAVEQPGGAAAAAVAEALGAGAAGPAAAGARAAAAVAGAAAAVAGAAAAVAGAASAGAAAAGAGAAAAAGVLWDEGVEAEAGAAASAAANVPGGEDEAVGSDDEGWQTAEEEVEEQTSSLLNFMDRLALS